MLSLWRNRSSTLYKIVCQLFLQSPPPSSLHHLYKSAVSPVLSTANSCSSIIVRDFSVSPLHRTMAGVETTGNGDDILLPDQAQQTPTVVAAKIVDIIVTEAAIAAEKIVADGNGKRSAMESNGNVSNETPITETARSTNDDAEAEQGTSKLPRKKSRRGWKGKPEKERRKWEHGPRKDTDGPPIEIGEFRKKTKKCAMLMAYCGAAYNGMQWNAGVPTIETCLFTAMEKLEMIPKEWYKDLHQLNFQRCARTDKGVSAAGQVVSVPLPVTDIATAVERINTELPSDIRLFGLRRVTQGFNSKTWCSSRTYLYMCPTMAFAPLEDAITYDYRMDPGRIEPINTLLKRYQGTNNFHNFTIGIKPWQDAAKRFMREVECGQPFVRDGIEFVVITVKGQSFMMHQIRKMIGLVIGVMRGHISPEIFETIFGPAKADVPRAPGLGLLLQAVQFDLYNQKFGSDGIHDSLTWPECQDAVEQFKEAHIYPVVVKGEREGLSMLTWLSHLPNHIFGYRQGDDRPEGTHTALGDALYTVEKTAERALLDAQSESEGEGLSDDADDAAQTKSAKKKRRIDVI